MLDQFVIFGDSITEGCFSQERGFACGAALADDYKRRLDVINRGFGGYTTQQARYILPETIPLGCKIRLLWIFFGANDAALPGKLQHVPLESYKENLVYLIRNASLKAHNPDVKIIVVTPGPIDEYLTDSDDRTAEHTQKYAHAAAGVARECGVPCVDLWGAFMRFAGWQEGQPLIGSKKLPQNAKLDDLVYDGLHFSPGGYRILYNEVTRTIAQHFPELASQKLPMSLIDWSAKPAMEVTKEDLFPKNGQRISFMQNI